VTSRGRGGEPVVIIGPGPIGLFSLQMCLAAGAGPIVLVGTPADRSRLKVGKALGAAVTINVEEEEPMGVIQDLTHGEGAHLVVDCAGPSAAVKLALEAAAPTVPIPPLPRRPPP